MAKFARYKSILVGTSQTGECRLNFADSMMYPCELAVVDENKRDPLNLAGIDSLKGKVLSAVICTKVKSGMRAMVSRENRRMAAPAPPSPMSTSVSMRAVAPSRAAQTGLAKGILPPANRNAARSCRANERLRAWV